MTQYPDLRINSLKNGIERKEPVGHPFVMKIIEPEAGLKIVPL